MLYSKAFIIAAYKLIELFNIARETYLYFDSRVGG
jgi:hypothetical protein